MAETKINANQTSITASDIGAIQNTATGTGALTILGTSTSQDDAINIGVGSVASSYSTVIGYNANASSSDVIIGRATRGNGQDVSIGLSAESRSINNVTVGFAAISYAIDSISIGAYAQATAANSVMINTSGDTANNNVAGTFNFANTNGNYQIVSADGTIPEARLADTTNAAQGQVLTLDSNLNAVWQAGGGGNYLPITGGTLEGELTMGTDPVTFQRYAVNFGNGCYLKADPFSTYTLMLSDGTAEVFKFNAGSGAITPSMDASYHTLGKSNLRWGNVYTTKLNNGADINIPTTGGTMAVIGVNTTVTLATANWSSNTQTVNVTGITATGVVFVSPDPTDQADYTSAGIICTAQAAGTLTFTCDSVPSGDIDVNVVCL